MTECYMSAKKICMGAIWDFGCDVNGLLADERGDYLIHWTLEDALYIQKSIHRIVSKILSTCMANHVAYELSNVQNSYDTSFNNKSIDGCKTSLKAMLEELRILHACCKAIK